LYNRLNELITNNSEVSDIIQLNTSIHDLGDKNDLRHGKNPSKNIYIFKSTDNGQVRLVYGVELDNQYLSIILYDHVQGSFNHSAYIDDFQRKYKFKKEFDFIRIPIKKN
jgi:hypothetical protein